MKNAAFILRSSLRLFTRSCEEPRIMIGFKLSLKRHKADNPGKKFRAKIQLSFVWCSFSDNLSWILQKREKEKQCKIYGDRILRNLPLLPHNKETKWNANDTWVTSLVIGWFSDRRIICRWMVWNSISAHRWLSYELRNFGWEFLSGLLDKEKGFLFFQRIKIHH